MLSQEPGSRTWSLESGFQGVWCILLPGSKRNVFADYSLTVASHQPNCHHFPGLHRESRHLAGTATAQAEAREPEEDR